MQSDACMLLHMFMVFFSLRCSVPPNFNGSVLASCCDTNTVRTPVKGVNFVSMSGEGRFGILLIDVPQLGGTVFTGTDQIP